MLKSIVAGAALSVVLAGTAYAECNLSADAKAGQATTNLCRACHIFEAGKPSRATGPNLHDVLGRKAGALDDFKGYSDGMKKAPAWDEAAIDKYITNPKDYVPGNKMVFAGIKEEPKRKQLIAYLKEIKSQPECK